MRYVSQRCGRWSVLILVLSVVAASGLSGCGSSSHSSSAKTSAGSGSQASAGSGAAAAGLAAAEKTYAAASTPPPKIPVTAPEGKPVPKNLSVAYINCGVPTCADISTAIGAAARVLGWKYTQIQTDGTPGSVKSGWETAVRLRPTAVFSSGFNRALFQPQLNQLLAEHTGIFDCCNTDSPTKDFVLNLGGPVDQATEGEYMAAAVTKDTGGKANALYVNLPDFAILNDIKTSFISHMKTYCPSCAVASINIPLSAIGTTSTDQIVSYLRAHPSVNFLALSDDAVSSGLPTALKAAGLSVKFVGEGGGAVNKQYVASGEQAADVVFPDYAFFWTMMDAVARWYNHESVTPDAIKAPYFLQVASNVNSTSVEITPNLESQFEKLWGR